MSSTAEASSTSTLRVVRNIHGTRIFKLLTLPIQDANYLLKSLQGFKSHGITAYAVRVLVHLVVATILMFV